MAPRPDRERATSGRPGVGPPPICLSRLPTPRPLLTLVALCALAIFFVTPSDAARQVELELDELLYRSALIFEGRVTRVDIAAGGHKAARTRVDFTVDRVLRGAIDRDALSFEVPEGVLPDGRLVETAETPRFAAGERYLVFVRGGPWRLSPIIDWQQGVLRLTTIGGHPVAVTDGGHCVSALDRRRLHFGPRVAPRLQWPGFPTTSGADPPKADAAGACLSATTVVARLDARVGELGLRGPAEPIRLTPVDDVRFTPSMAPGDR